MITGSHLQPSLLYCSSDVYAYTPLFSVESQDDSDDRPCTVAASFTHTTDFDNDQPPPSVHHSHERFNPTEVGHSTPMSTDTIYVDDSSAQGQCESSAASASEDHVQQVQVLDEEWHNKNRLCLQQIDTLPEAAFQQWQAYDSTWQNIELYQYQHYESLSSLCVQSIYRSQRIKLQTQLRSVLNNDHPALLDMDSEHDQHKQNIDVQMDSRMANADDMHQWERDAIDREHKVSNRSSFCVACCVLNKQLALLKETVESLDDELLDYLSEIKRVLLIEGDLDIEVPKDLLSLYQDGKDERSNSKQYRAQQVLLKHRRSMNHILFFLYSDGLLNCPVLP
ncbi:hypothetical protein [Absidia glauca]|uniref:Uncharacterized protein n=1 Tax=Absidia glauca TaxID=4829 RepID=A0A168MS90_ABSGL|nr:hypothetical protein [Absidia glauca]